MYRISTLGSVVASFGLPGGVTGATFDGEYLWAEIWLNPWWTFQYDIGVTAVEPASLGRVKALYR
jgi:hypothetical protein